MGKTDAVKKRRVDGYPPSLEAKEKWKALAEEAGMSPEQEAHGEGMPGTQRETALGLREADC